MKTSTDMGSANFPTDAEGHTYHLGVKPGDVARRIIGCGER